jgi:D-alanyl-D-alanine carboxypeptidase
MVKNTAYKYEGAVGGKLGYTEEALYTIVTVAERDGRTLICVCLRSDPYVQQYSDAAEILDFAFDNYRRTEMTADDLSVRSISFALEEGQKTPATASVLTTGESVYYLPIGLSAEDYTLSFNYTESGNKMGGFAPKAIITLNNPPSGVPAVIEVPLSSTITASAQMQDVPKEEPQEEKKASGIFTVILNVVKWIVIVVLFLVALILAIRTWNIYNRRKQRRKRMERRHRQAQHGSSTARQYRNDVRTARKPQNKPRSRSKIDLPIDRDSRY